MIEKLISDIEAKIRSETMSDSAKSELLQSLTKLKDEMAAMEKTSEEKLQALKSPIEELRTSVEGFGQSHPKLVETVNNISSALSNLGI